MSLRSSPSLRGCVDRLGIHVVDLLQSGLVDDERGEIFAPRRQQGRHQERPPEDQGRDPQRRVRPQPARGRLKQGAAPVSKVEARRADRSGYGRGRPGRAGTRPSPGAGRGLRRASSRRRPRDRARPAARPRSAVGRRRRPFADPRDQEVELLPCGFALLQPLGNSHRRVTLDPIPDHADSRDPNDQSPTKIW